MSTSFLAEPLFISQGKTSLLWYEAFVLAAGLKTSAEGCTMVRSDTILIVILYSIRRGSEEIIRFLVWIESMGCDKRRL